MRRTTLASLGIAAASTALTGTALAGNADTYALSNDAAVVGGAVTATTKGGGAVWYNPAGLAADTRSSVDVSANAYVVRFGGTPDLIATSTHAQQQQLSSFDFNTVPTSLGITHRLGSVNLGIGVFVPSQQALSPRTLIRLYDANGQPLATAAIDGYERYSQTYAGLGAGFTLSPTLRLGATLFGVYSTLDQATDTILADEQTVNAQASLTHAAIDQMQLGLQMVFGLKWTPTPKWAIGLVTRTPVVSVFSVPQEVVLAVNSGPPGANAATHTASFSDQTSLGGGLMAPMRETLGIARIEDRVKYSLEVNAIAPLWDSTSLTQTRGVVNVGGGVRYRVSTPMAIGGGFHTDFSEAEPDAPTVIDYYSFSLGTEFGTAYREENEDDPTQPVRHTIMTTTIAASYAVGIGHLANETVALQPNGVPTFTNVPAHVVAHEITLYLGSSVAF